MCLKYWLRRCRVIVATGALASLALMVGPLGISSAAAQVSSAPASGTPQLASTGSTEQIRQIVQCGGTMYAVGSFTSIFWKGTTYARKNAFSFSATAPYAVTSWNPNVNGMVNTIAFNGSSCDTAYIGGKFTSVNGTAASNIAAVSTSTGACTSPTSACVTTAFAHSANGQVATIASAFGHLLVGGYFTSINGNGGADKYMASLNPSTGKDDGFVKLNISGHSPQQGYYYCSGSKCTGSNPVRVWNQQISPDGTLDLVEGDFTSVGGLPRQQVFMLKLATSAATVTGWTSPQLKLHCSFNEAMYAQAASWSPNGNTVYVATTGFHPYNWNGSFPFTWDLSSPDPGICDAAVAFPATQSSVSPLWVNYTGCDSLYSTAADSTMSYFGGHERWSQNPNGCDSLGRGGFNAPGMEGLYPATGLLYLNSSGTAGYYSRGRGLGADDMLVTSAGLWIASDNLNNTNQCGGVPGHAGICFLPYPSG